MYFPLPETRSLCSPAPSSSLTPDSLYNPAMQGHWISLPQKGALVSHRLPQAPAVCRGDDFLALNCFFPIGKWIIKRSDNAAPSWPFPLPHFLS